MRSVNDFVPGDIFPGMFNINHLLDYICSQLVIWIPFGRIMITRRLLISFFLMYGLLMPMLHQELVVENASTAIAMIGSCIISTEGIN